MESDILFTWNNGRKWTGIVIIKIVVAMDLYEGLTRYDRREWTGQTYGIKFTGNDGYDGGRIVLILRHRGPRQAFCSKRSEIILDKKQVTTVTR